MNARKPDLLTGAELAEILASRLTRLMSRQSTPELLTPAQCSLDCAAPKSADPFGAFSSSRAAFAACP